MHLLLKSRLYIYCVLQLFTILTLVMSFSPVNKYLKGTVHPKIKRYIFSLYLLLLFFFLFFFCHVLEVLAIEMSAFCVI